MHGCAVILKRVSVALVLCLVSALAQANTLAYQHYVLDPETQNASVTVFSQSNGNIITAGTTVLTLDENNTGSIPAGVDLAPGTLISGTGSFSLASEREFVDVPSPAAFMGTRFVVPHTANAHRIYLFSPTGDATVSIEIDGSNETVQLTEGDVFEYSLGADNSIATIVESDLPILVSHVGDTVGVRRDTFPVPPASLEVWGVRSGNAILGALEDNTSVTVFSSDGNTAIYILNRGDRQEISIGVDDNHGQGSGLRVVADKPVAAVQYNDGDGTEAISFLPSHYLGTHYGISLDTQYLAVVCPSPGTTVTLEDELAVPTTLPCNGNSDSFPGKIYFGSTDDGVHISSGATLSSNKPVFVYQETFTGSAEKQLIGAKNSYFILDPWTGGSPLSIFSHVDGNTISAGTSTFQLERNELHSFPIGTALGPGTEITGTGAFDLGSTDDGTDLPVHAAFLGIQFAIPHIRGHHIYDLFSPVGNASVEVSIGSTVNTVNLEEGQVLSYYAGSDNSGAGIVRSSNPVYVYHRAQSTQSGGSRYDAYPVPPATLELWGVRSRRLYVAAVENDTSVVAYTDTGQIQNLMLQTGQRPEITVGSNSSQGGGSAVHLVSSKPIAAIRYADSDGSETTSLWSSIFSGSRFGVPIDAQYISITCLEPNTELTLSDVTESPENLSCSRSGHFPGSARFGSSASGVHVSAGALLESSKPIVVYYEGSATNDEKNLIGTLGVSQNTAVAAFVVTPEEGNAPLEVLFDGSSSTSANPISSFEWDFGDGQMASGETVNHAYQRSGNYATTLSIEDSAGERDHATATIRVAPPAPGQLVIEHGVLSSVTENWQTVTLENYYTSMVVIATPVLPDQSAPPVVTRIRNASNNQFELRLQNPSGLSLPEYAVHYLVVEEGQYSEADHGVSMEAISFNSTITASTNSWLSQTVEYHNHYTNPVVLGQIMSVNDSRWSTFWASSDGNHRNIPGPERFSLGKHIAQDTDNSRDDEVLGYLVIESGIYDLSGTLLTALVGNDDISGVDNSASGFTLPIPETLNATTAIVSVAAMDGNDGGWPVLFGAQPLADSAIQIVIDEDQILDTERSHTTEQVAALVLSGPENIPPVAEFDATPVSGSAPLFVDVDATGSSDTDGEIVDFRWDFGDGNTTNGVTTRHEFLSPGSYEIQLEVEDDDGLIDTHRISIDVLAPNQVPVALFEPSSTTGSAPFEVTFNAIQSLDPDGVISSYSWNFGDGGTATGVAATYVFSAAGDYPVTLTVTDNEGASSTFSQIISVSLANIPPIAAFTPLFTIGEAPLRNSFDGTGSSDPDGSIVLYEWDFGDGSMANGVTTEYSFIEPGNYTISLTVVDDQGASNTLSQTISVEDETGAPIAYFDATPLAGNHPLTVSFDASSSGINGIQIAEYRWDFGDGYALHGHGAGAIYPEHSYPGPGNFIARLTVTDNTDEQYFFERQIRVNALPLAAYTTSLTVGYAPFKITFDAGESTDSDDEIVEYSWNFGDGEIATGIVVEHEYQEAGIYFPSLTVTDSFGAQDIVTSTIVAEEIPTIITPVLTVGSGNTFENPVLITGTATPSHSIDVVVNDVVRATGNVGDNGSFEIPTPLNNGTNIVYAVSRLDSVSSDQSNTVSLVYQNNVPRELGGQIVDSLLVLTLREDNEPYLLTVGDLEITQSGKLVVLPGVRIDISNGNQIRINGSLEMAGTEDNQIVLTSGEAAPTPGDWSGLSVYSADRVTITNTIIEYADTCVTINANDALLTFQHNVIQNCSESGIDLPSENTISNSEIRNNLTGIHVRGYGQNSLIRGNLIDSNSDGILVEGLLWFNANIPFGNPSGIASPTIESNTIQGNVNGIHMRPRSGGEIVSNTISNNELGINLIGQPDGNILREMEPPQPQIRSNQIFDNTSIVTGFNPRVRRLNIFADKYYNRGERYMIDARENWWGTNNPADVADQIHHQSPVCYLHCYLGQLIEPWIDYSDFLDAPEGEPQEGNFIYRITGDISIPQGEEYTIVEENMIVPSDFTMTLERGSKLVMSVPTAGYAFGSTIRNLRSISVRGNLVVSGLVDEPVIFRSASSSENSWIGIGASGSSSVVLDHTVVEGAYTGFTQSGFNSDVIISNSMFRKNDWGIQLLEGRSFEFRDGVLTGNNYGLVVSGDLFPTLVKRSDIYDNDLAGLRIGRDRSNRNPGNRNAILVDATENWWGKPAPNIEIGLNAVGDLSFMSSAYESWISYDPSASDPNIVTVPETRTISSESFSPDENGVLDVIEFTGCFQDIESWIVQIRDPDGNIVRTFTGTSQCYTSQWDGTDDDQSVVNDGKYEVLIQRQSSPEIDAGVHDYFVINTVVPVVIPPANIYVEAQGADQFVSVGSAIATDVQGNALPVNRSIESNLFPPGEHEIIWTATDQSGNTGSAIQTVSVMDTVPPVLSVPDDLVLFGDTDREIDIGEAVAQDIFVTTISNNAPTLFPVGITEVTWTATDSSGNSSSSIQTVEITGLSVSIFSPVQNAVVYSDSILVTGTLRAPLNTRLIVNGRLASIDASKTPMEFVAVVPLREGGNTVEISATSYTGLEHSQSLIVSRQITEPTHYGIVADVTTGMAPLTVEFTFSGISNVDVDSIVYDWEGDGIDDFTYDLDELPEGATLIQPYHYTASGIYFFRATIVDNSGDEETHTIPILVEDPDITTGLITNLWGEFNDHMLGGDLSQAGSLMSDSFELRQREVMEAIYENYDEILSTYGELDPISVNSVYASFLLNREIEGENYAYLIYFMKGDDGFWRLVSM